MSEVRTYYPIKERFFTSLILFRDLVDQCDDPEIKNLILPLDQEIKCSTLPDQVLDEDSTTNHDSSTDS